MKAMLLCLLFLASIMASVAREYLQGKVFVFPAATQTSAVVVKTPVEQPLTSFTLCLKHYTFLTREHYIFSYAVAGSDNEILYGKTKPNAHLLFVGGTIVDFTLPEKQAAKPNWEHVCMSWESATGLVEFWLNEEALPRAGLRKGYSVKPKASIILSQDQDTFGGGFETRQAFVGELKDVYMWDRVLTRDELSLVWSGGRISNPLINWNELEYEIKPDVFVEPSLLPSACRGFAGQ